jgi:periplasmic protein TonB
MTTYSKIFVPAAIYVAILFHVVVLFRQFKIASPEELQEPESPFQYIEAVMVEAPPEPVAVLPPPPPPPEPEPEPPVTIEPEPTSEAVEISTEIEEVEVPAPPEPVAAPVDQPTSDVGSQAALQGAATEPVVTVGTPAPTESQATVFLPFYKVEKRPTFLSKAKLEYPSQAKRRRIEGVVIIEADIDAKGEIVDTRVVKEEGFGFEEAAIEMLMGSLFSPAIIDGRPVAVRMRFTIEFRLN